MIEVTCRYDDGTGCPVLVVSGPLRDADLPIFRTVLEGALEGGHRSVVVDLAGADVAAPRVLRHCTSVAARLERTGRRLELVGLHDGAPPPPPPSGRRRPPAAVSTAPAVRRPGPAPAPAGAGARTSPLPSTTPAARRADGTSDRLAAVAALQREVEGLRAAMQSRATIEQAKGIVMSTVGCDADHAFALLVQQSQHENRKLRDVAAELVARQSSRSPLKAV